MIEAGLRGAFMLARGQAHGAMLIEDTPEGAARSFWAAAICLPGLLALMLFDWAGEPPAAGVGHALLLHLLARGGGWAGFAVASHALAQASGRVSAWPHFIAAWNWANVVQYLLFLAVSATAMLGLPGVLASALALAMRLSIEGGVRGGFIGAPGTSSLLTAASLVHRLGLGY